MTERLFKFRAWTGISMEYNVVLGALGAFYVQGLNPEDTACLSPFNTKYSEQTPIMQYTGLKGKDGVELYEGDYVSLKGSTGIWLISWEKFRFVIKPVKEPEGVSLNNLKPDDWASMLVVLGNMYENPELVGGVNV